MIAVYGLWHRLHDTISLVELDLKNPVLPVADRL